MNCSFWNSKTEEGVIIAVYLFAGAGCKLVKSVLQAVVQSKS